MWRRGQHLLEYAAFRCVGCFALALPWRASVRACERLAWFVTNVLPRRLTRYGIARENLERAYGPLPDDEVDRIVRGMWTHLFRMFVELLQLPRKLRLESCGEYIDFRDGNLITEALRSGRPVLVLSGHFGNWELANRALGLFGFHVGVVARDLDNPHLNAWFARYRRAEGHRLISKTGGGDAIVAQLAAGGSVAMLGDQDAGAKGMFVEFFGRPASTHKSIALLALRFRALIVVTGTRRLPDDREARWSRFEIRCEEVVDPDHFADEPEAVRRITERYTAAVERTIRRSPEQYFWVHRRWKSVPFRRRERERHERVA